MSIHLNLYSKRWLYFKSLVILGVAMAVIHHVFPLQQWYQLVVLGTKIPLMVAGPMLLSAVFTYGLVTAWDYRQRQNPFSGAASKAVPTTIFREILMANLRRGLWLDGSRGHRGNLAFRAGAQREKLIYGCALAALCAGEVSLAPYLFGLAKEAHIFMGAILLAGSLALFAARACLLSSGRADTNVSRQLLKQLVGSENHAFLKQIILYVPAGLALYLPLIHFAGMAWNDFIALYIVAHMAGVASRLPGGAGVFEGVFLFLAASHYPAAQVFVALMAYRSLYYILPLLSSAAALLIVESHRKKTANPPGFLSIYHLPHKLFQPLVSLVLLALGMDLLGVFPAELAEAVFAPLPKSWPPYLINLGGLLVLLTWRCHWRRIDLGYRLVGLIGAVLVAGYWGSQLYFKAITCLLLLGLFLASKSDFYRCNAVSQGLIARGRLGWHLFGVFLLIGPIVFLNETNDLGRLLLTQWLFADSLAPWEQLLFVTGLGVGLIAIYPLLMRCDIPLALPVAAEMAEVQALVANATETQPHLVLCGDKYLFWSPSRKTFIMFGKTPGFWVAMGDPVGEPLEVKELVNALIALADSAGAQLAFYKVSSDNLALYADLGLGVSKLGEEARIPLAEFSMAGSKRLSIRNSYNRHQKEGLIFDVVGADRVHEILPQLKTISDSWLSQKLAKEKQFSLGAFDAQYLQFGDVAVVRQAEKIVAFANLWCLQNKQELSLDIMRYAEDAPKRVMEFLTLSLILWGQAQGYGQFNLGMAPLAGLQIHRRAPLLHKLGNTIYCHGTRFYNFPGIYAYKDKFTPQWHSRYLVGPTGWQTLAALFAVAKLIAGGARGLIQK